MSKKNTWCKLFDTKRGQSLVRKSISDEQDPALSVQIEVPVGYAENCFAFREEGQRDHAFDNWDQEQAEKVTDAMFNEFANGFMSKEEAEAKAKSEVTADEKQVMIREVNTSEGAEEDTDVE